MGNLGTTQSPNRHRPIPKLRRHLAWRNKLRFQILRRDGFTCRYCGRTVADGARLELDHIVPKSLGGRESAENLLTACHKCNQGKDGQLLNEPQIKLVKMPFVLASGWLSP